MAGRRLAVLVATLVLLGACSGSSSVVPDATPDEPDAPPPDAPGPPDAVPPPQCDDGLDNDGDGIVDFGSEPGCVQPDDDDELDDCPSGPGCPQCSNGIDDDGDGDVDEADIGCDSAGDPEEGFGDFAPCGPAIEIVDITVTGTASGTFSGGPDELQSPVCNGLGNEKAFYFAIPNGPVTLVVSTDDPATTVDTIVYVRSVCRMEDSELGCDDDGGTGTGGPSLLTLSGVPADGYYIIVDTFGPGSLGDFVLTVTATPE
jgi:large repetitive protein